MNSQLIVKTRRGMAHAIPRLLRTGIAYLLLCAILITNIPLAFATTVATIDVESLFSGTSVGTCSIDPDAEFLNRESAPVYYQRIAGDSMSFNSQATSEGYEWLIMIGTSYDAEPPVISSLTADTPYYNLAKKLYEDNIANITLDSSITSDDNSVMLLVYAYCWSDENEDAPYAGYIHEWRECQ